MRETYEDMGRILDEEAELLLEPHERQRVAQALGEYVLQNYVEVEPAADAPVWARMDEIARIIDIFDKHSHDPPGKALLALHRYLEERGEEILELAGRKPD